MIIRKILGNVLGKLNTQDAKALGNISSAPVINCNVFGEKAIQSASKKVLNNSENKITTLLNNSERVASKSETKCVQSPLRQEFNDDEITVFNDVLKEYRELKPADVSSGFRTYGETFEQINGDKVSLNKWIENDKVTGIQLTTAENKSFGYDLELNRFYNSNPSLQKEFETFLNGKQPSVDSINEFVKLRNMRYLRDNEIYSLKSIKTSMEKGKEIEQQEKLHRDKVQKKYNKIWRSYPTEQFYRVIGMSELKAILRGEKIVSKNSVARYGRPCVDITPNGYYHEIFYGEPKFRIAFKRKDPDGGWHERLTSKIYPFRKENQHYQVSSYDYKDVDMNKLTIWDGDDWSPFSLK